MRCLRRSDLLEALAGDLPVNTIRYGSNVVSINLDQFTSRPLLHFGDGTTLLPKIVIGCDGVNSVVAKYLGMKAPRHFKTCVVRGFTRASRRDDKFQSQFVVTSKGNVQLGTMPVNHHLHYWFVTRPWTSQDSVILSDENLIKESTVKVLSTLGFLQEDLDLVKKSDLHHLHLAPLRYRAPWELITGTRIRKGTVTVAGDAMHAMGPFIAQGGSASLEDAVILARCLAPTIVAATKLTMRLDWKNERKKVETAIDEYVKERKKRLIGLSTHAFLIGTRIDSSHTRSLWLRPIVKFMCVALLVIFFSDPCCHTRYDCGRL
ncbi:6-hydroxynicotinate 3-monooxygenase [Bertholletia excelsa]